MSFIDELKIGENFFRLAEGPKGSYKPDTDHKGCLYLASDEKEILKDGKTYGFSPEMKKLVSEISYDGGTFTVRMLDGSELPFVILKEDIGLGNVTNDEQVKRSELDKANGVPLLDENGHLYEKYFNGSLRPVIGLEGFVESYDDLASVPAREGDVWYENTNGKLYTRLADSWSDGVTPRADTLYNNRGRDSLGRTNVLYRWDGKFMVEVSSTVVLGEIEGTAYDGAKGKELHDAVESLPDAIVSALSNDGLQADGFHISAKKSVKQGLGYGEAEDVNIIIPYVTQTTGGMMSPADKTKLDTLKDIEPGGDSGQAFPNDRGEALENKVTELEGKLESAVTENEDLKKRVEKLEASMQQVIEALTISYTE